MKAATLETYRRDPLAFIAALAIPSAHGPVLFGDVLATFQREWFAAVVPSLLAFAIREQPPCGRFWIERTKGGSKDSDLATVLVWLLVFTRWTFTGQIGAADRDQANEVRRAVADLLRLNPWLYAFIKCDKYAINNPKTESVVEIVPADASGSHGSRGDLYVVNELSHIAGDDGREFASNLLDNASKRQRGLVFIATNAGYLGTWQADWRAMALASERWDFHKFAEPAPWLGEAELSEAKRRNSPKRYARLYSGVWPASVGDALDESWIQRAIKPGLRPMIGNEPGYSFSAGLDLSTRRDRSALVVLGYNPQQRRVRLAHCQSWKPSAITGEVDLLAVERGVLAAHERFNLAALVYDPSQAAHMVQVLRRQHGLNTIEQPFAGKHLNTMAEVLLQVFADGDIDLYQHATDFSEELIQDLFKLTIVEKSFGYKLEAVRDSTGHADLGIALSIVLPYAKRFIAAGLWNEDSSMGRISVPQRSPSSFGIPLHQHGNSSWQFGPSGPTGYDGNGSFPY